LQNIENKFVSLKRFNLSQYAHHDQEVQSSRRAGRAWYISLVAKDIELLKAKIV
jgi:hypothetical protein